MADKIGKGEVCRDFLRGTCTRGAKCKYAHVSSGEAALAGLSFRADKPIDFCHDYQNGRCNRPTCKFIHCSKEEEEEFRRSGKLPAQFGVEASATYQAIPTATGRRAHGQEEGTFLDFGSALMPLGGAQFLSGATQKNTALALQQSVQAFQQMAAASFPQFNQTVSEEVCKDNLAGKCTRGARCKYRHVTRTQVDYDSQMHDASRRNGGFSGDRRKRSRSRSRSRSSRSRSRSSSRDGRARRLMGVGAQGLVDPLAASALGVSAMLNLQGNAAQQGLLNVNQAVNAASLFGMSAAGAPGVLGMGVDPSTGMPMAYMPMMSVHGAGANLNAAAANLNSMFAAAPGGAASLSQANVDPFSYATNQ